MQTNNKRGKLAELEITAAENRLKALTLRKSGASYQQIAERLQVSKSTAFDYVKEELSALAAETRLEAEEYRELELTRLDVAQVQVSALLNSESDLLKLQAADRQIKLSESRRKLLGLDAPTKTESTHTHSGIGLLGFGELSDDELNRKLAEAAQHRTADGEIPATS